MTIHANTENTQIHEFIDQATQFFARKKTISVPLRLQRERNKWAKLEAQPLPKLANVLLLRIVACICEKKIEYQVKFDLERVRMLLVNLIV